MGAPESTGQWGRPALITGMRLEQGQIWRKGDDHYRIVTWARMSIEYKHLKEPASREGTLHTVTKKEFCRLLKGAELLQPEADLSAEA